MSQNYLEFQEFKYKLETYIVKGIESQKSTESTPTISQQTQGNSF
jgi:hypothetical protein